MLNKLDLSPDLSVNQSLYQPKPLLTKALINQRSSVGSSTLYQ
ncbi:hypothetical protein FORC066_0936 [Yersinia enterocolitica]|nr:hypothetical protein FORC066_0936 [Yersinia enterocolitica]